MKFRTVLLAVVGICAASSIAFANTSPKNQNHPTSREGWSDRCAALDAQFDGLVDKHKDNPELDAADQLHADGVSACAASETTTGVTKLEEAIRKLGVEPAN